MWHRAISRRLLPSAALGAACSSQQCPKGSRPTSCVKSKATSCNCEVQKPDGNKNVDVLVLGGGIVGISTALFLAKAGTHVLLVETQALGSGATGMSCATVCSKGNGDGSKAIESMAHCTMQTLRELQGLADAGDHDFDCGFNECGVLELLRTEKELKKALADVDDLQRHGYEAQVISPAAAEQLEPALKASPGLLGVMHLPKSGYADPNKTVQALEKRAADAGAEIWEGWEAVAATREGHGHCGKTWLVELASRSKNSSDSEKVSCNHIILATGAWANATGKIFGLEVPVARVKAQMWSAKARSPSAAKLSHVIYGMQSHLFWAEIDTKDLSAGTPNLVTHSAKGERYCYHVYGRPSSDDAEEVCFGGDRLPLSLQMDPADYQPHPTQQQENFRYIAESLLPALELHDAEPGGWCGVVGSSLHGGVLVGEVTFLPGLWLCTGFGGSGFMKGIGAAKAISEWITAGANKTNFPVLQVEANPTPWLRSSSTS